MSGPYRDHILGPYRPAACTNRGGMDWQSLLLERNPFLGQQPVDYCSVSITRAISERTAAGWDGVWKSARRITAHQLCEDEAKKGVWHRPHPIPIFPCLHQ